MFFFFFSSRRRHTRSLRDWSSDVCSSDLLLFETARKFDRAAEYFRLAAVNAAHVGASHEAITLAKRGLTLLDKMSGNADRGRQELSLRMTLGGPLTLASFGS